MPTARTWFTAEWVDHYIGWIRFGCEDHGLEGLGGLGGA